MPISTATAKDRKRNHAKMYTLEQLRRNQQDALQEVDRLSFGHTATEPQRYSLVKKMVEVRAVQDKRAHDLVRELGMLCANDVEFERSGRFEMVIRDGRTSL